MNNLLTRELPLHSTIRLWDTYLAESDDFAVFQLYVCAAFLLHWREQLLKENEFQVSICPVYEQINSSFREILYKKKKKKQSLFLFFTIEKKMYIKGADVTSSKFANTQLERFIY